MASVTNVSQWPALIGVAVVWLAIQYCIVGRACPIDVTVCSYCVPIHSCYDVILLFIASQLVLTW